MFIKTFDIYTLSCVKYTTSWKLLYNIRSPALPSVTTNRGEMDRGEGGVRGGCGCVWVGVCVTEN